METQSVDNDQRMQFLNVLLHLATDAALYQSEAILIYVDKDTQYMPDNKNARTFPPYCIAMSGVQEEGKVIVFTNIDDIYDFLGCCSVLNVTISGKTQNGGMHFMKKLVEHVRNGNRAGGSAAGRDLAMGLFRNGSAALVSSSQAEYLQLKAALVHNGFILDRSVSEKIWDDLGKYVFYDAKKRKVRAFPRVPEGVEKVLATGVFIQGR